MIDFAPNQASWLGAYGRHGVTAQAHGNRVRNESCASSISLTSQPFAQYSPILRRVSETGEPSSPIPLLG
jgi:hypothetical protein